MRLLMRFGRHLHARQLGGGSTTGVKETPFLCQNSDVFDYRASGGVRGIWESPCELCGTEACGDFGRRYACGLSTEGGAAQRPRAQLPGGSGSSPPTRRQLRGQVMLQLSARPPSQLQRAIVQQHYSTEGDLGNAFL